MSHSYLVDLALQYQLQSVATKHVLRHSLLTIFFQESARSMFYIYIYMLQDRRDPPPPVVWCGGMVVVNH